MIDAIARIERAVFVIGCVVTFQSFRQEVLQVTGVGNKVKEKIINVFAHLDFRLQFNLKLNSDAIVLDLCRTLGAKLIELSL